MTHYQRWQRTGNPLTPPQSKTTHGLWNHRLYPIWHGMMVRCYRPHHPAYRFYGARGITVCARWHDVENFITDMSPRPPGHSMDRIDSNGPYAPENVRWATSTVQGRNKRGIKIDELMASQIRELHAAGTQQVAIAGQFGISKPTVNAIVHGRIWR